MRFPESVREFSVWYLRIKLSVFLLPHRTNTKYFFSGHLCTLGDTQAQETVANSECDQYASGTCVLFLSCDEYLKKQANCSQVVHLSCEEDVVCKCVAYEEQERMVDVELECL